MAPCVNFVTGNANKLREVKAILEPAIEVRSNPLDVEEVQGSIEEVTQSKCRRAAELVSKRAAAHPRPRRDEAKRRGASRSMVPSWSRTRRFASML